MRYTRRTNRKNRRNRNRNNRKKRCSSRRFQGRGSRALVPRGPRATPHTHSIHNILGNNTPPHTPLLLNPPEVSAVALRPPAQQGILINPEDPVTQRRFETELNRKGLFGATATAAIAALMLAAMPDSQPHGESSYMRTPKDVAMLREQAKVCVPGQPCLYTEQEQEFAKAALNRHEVARLSARYRNKELEMDHDRVNREINQARRRFNNQKRATQKKQKNNARLAKQRCKLQSHPRFSYKQKQSLRGKKMM